MKQKEPPQKYRLGTISNTKLLKLGMEYQAMELYKVYVYPGMSLFYGKLNLSHILDLRWAFIG